MASHVRRLKQFVCLAVLAPVCLAARLQAAELPEFAASAVSLAPVSVSPELGFAAFHVQGLVVTGDSFIFSSVDKPGFAAWLFRVDRKTMKVVNGKNLAKLMDFHPGGIDFDGKNLWVPVAVYAPRSHTNVMVVDPETFKTRKAFEVEDHIGAVACVGDVIVGASWDAEEFYFWTAKGEPIEKKQRPGDVGYQDCKGVNGFLMCNGGGYLDWIDVDRWEIVKRIESGVSLEGNSLSREGAALYGEHVFFLPDDGPGARIYEYSFSRDKNTGAATSSTFVD